MPKNKNKNEERKNEPVETTPETPTESQTSTNTVLLVIVIVLLCLIVLGGLGIGGWYFWQSQKEQKIKQLESQIQTEVSDAIKNESQVANSLREQGLVYENKDFGYRLNFTPSWEKYRAEGGTMGGDFEVNRMCFFLPTKYPEYTGELPEYTSPFCISAFVAYSWDEEQKRNSGGLLPMGEVVGRNSKYVLVYSHFNGEMPPDVPQQAVLDMQIIAEGIEVFEPQSSPGSAGTTGAVVGDSAGGTLDSPAAGTRPTVNPDFQMSGVYYWNCKHRYTMTYPAAWSNNGMTSNSNVVILKGNQVQLWIEAVPITVTETLQGFAKKREAKISGELVWVESIDWNGEATLYRATYRNPDSIVLWWQAGDYGMELRAFGPGYNKEYDNIFNAISTLDPNKNVYQCNSGVSETNNYKKATATEMVGKCSYPNGDVVDWWCAVSEGERDCYEDENGDPPEISDSDCDWNKKKPKKGFEECPFPDGDVENWWDDASKKEKDCFEENGGIPPED
jgi:hypothetical protein